MTRESAIKAARWHQDEYDVEAMNLWEQMLGEFASQHGIPLDEAQSILTDTFIVGNL